MEEPQLEEIPEELIPIAKTSVQSSSGWRQAESAVTSKTDSKIQIS
jgi:hypothetical protein